MVEIRTSKDHPSSMAERIAKRERNSGSPSADVVYKQGDGARRTFHNISHSANHTSSKTQPVSSGEKK
jgi:hypothetical protein